MNPVSTIKAFIPLIQKLTALSSVGLALSGCEFGNNKQFFEGSGNGTTASASATPSASVTPAPSASVTPSPSVSPTPTATPTSSVTPTPTPVNGGGATPTPTPTATPHPTSTPTPTATPNPGTPPIAVNDGPYEIAVNQTLTIQTSTLLANDYDPHGLSIHYVSFQAPSGGTLTLSGSTFTFVPANNFVGTVTFVYTIANSLNLTASATVTIDVRTAATEVMYGQSPSTLYSYDPSSNQSTEIANFKLANGSSIEVRDIAITTNGLMYAVDGASLYYVNATSGVLTALPTAGISSFGNINGLTALSNGDLVISGNGVVLYNVATQTLTTLLAPGGYQSSGDIIALPDGYLYMSAMTNGNDQLIRIDPTSGATTNLGSLGIGEVYGLGYADGNLYGFDDNGEVFQITINTNNTVSKSNVVNTGIEWYGATTNPVLW